MDTAPFLRWAGAKRAQVDLLMRYVPESYNRYFEPFLGSGALFFRLQPSIAVLGDSIPELMMTYRAVRDHPEPIHRVLGSWTVDRDTYYKVRALRPKGRVERAARFIYLNKTCWNGLYRVNSGGNFNVPFGRPKSENIVSLDRLAACSTALKNNVSLWTADFAKTLRACGPGDVVFLDPPYVTGHQQNGFIDYNEKLFSWKDQERLAQCAVSLAANGATVIVTNANHPSILSLYDGFISEPFARYSTLASSVKHRRLISELIISNRRPEG